MDITVVLTENDQRTYLEERVITQLWGITDEALALEVVARHVLSRLLYEFDGKRLYRGFSEGSAQKRIN